MNQALQVSVLSLVGFLSLSAFEAPVLAQVFEAGPSPSSLFDTVLNLPGDEAVINGNIFPSIGGAPGLTTQLNVDDGGTVPLGFDANSGSEVNVSGGNVGIFFTAGLGSEVSNDLEFQ